MNIYIATSLATSEEARIGLSKLAQYLKDKGHKVNDGRLKDKLKEQTYSEDELSKHYKSMLNSIKQCDVMIVDISSRSSGLGYEIALALNEKKPTLALFTGTSRSNSSFILTSNPSKLFKIAHYTAEDIIEIAEGFMQNAKEMIDTKFILIISPEIDKYLTWVADERRMHKAQVVRNAVDDMMNKDKEYKAFLKSQGLD